jgi:hypothetical protein
MALNAMPAEGEQWNTDEGTRKSHAQKREEIGKLANRLGTHKKINQHAAKNRLNILKLRK